MRGSQPIPHEVLTRQGPLAGPSGGPSCVANAPDAPGMGPPCHLPFMTWTLPTALSQALPPGNATGDPEAQDTVLVRGHARL